MAVEALPAGLRVISRGMLNSNLVVLLERGNNVLIDSGYCTCREQTLELLAGPGGLDGEPLERLVNTHCHADHVGGNAAVASAYGCRITIPRDEVEHVQPWTRESAWMEEFGQRADPFRFDDTIAPGDAFEAGGREWQAHAAPGHDMGALMFFEPRERLLVSGDALWEEGMGIVWPHAAPNPAIEAALATLAAIERLDPRRVIPGHGPAFAEPRRAIAQARSRLEAFAADPARNARHVFKVLFAFSLLDRGEMPLAAVPAHLAGIPGCRELAERFLGEPAGALAPAMLDELERAGAIRIQDGVVRPLMPA